MKPISRTKSSLNMNLVVTPERRTATISPDVFSPTCSSALYPSKLDFSHELFILSSIDGMDMVKPSILKEISVAADLSKLTSAITSGLLRGGKLLKLLDISYNKFSANSREMFDKELGILKQLPDLTHILIEGNQYGTVLRNYRPAVIVVLPKLESLDGQIVSREEVASAMDAIRTRAENPALDSSSSDSSLGIEQEDEDHEKVQPKKLFGLTLVAIAQQEQATFPGIIDECVSTLEERSVPDMFTKDPPEDMLAQLRKAFMVSEEDGSALAATMPPNVSAYLLRDFFRSLVEPPIPLWAHESVLQACLSDFNKNKEINKTFRMLPPANKPSVVRVCTFLHDFCEHPEVNARAVKLNWAMLLFGRTTDLTNEEKLSVMDALFQFAVKVTEDEERSSATASTQSSVSEASQTHHRPGGKISIGSTQQNGPMGETEESEYTDSFQDSESVSESDTYYSSQSETRLSKEEDGSIGMSNPSLKHTISQVSKESQTSRRLSIGSASANPDKMKRSLSELGVPNLVGIVVRQKKRGPGVKIVRIVGNSPAEQQDTLDVHDKITSINGMDVSELSEQKVASMLQDFREGQSVELKVERDIGEEDPEHDFATMTAAAFWPDEERDIRAEDAPDFSSGQSASDIDSDEGTEKEREDAELSDPAKLSEDSGSEEDEIPPPDEFDEYHVQHNRDESIVSSLIENSASKENFAWDVMSSVNSEQFEYIAPPPDSEDLNVETSFTLKFEMPGYDRNWRDTVAPKLCAGIRQCVPSIGEVTVQEFSRDGVVVLAFPAPSDQKGSQVAKELKAAVLSGDARSALQAQGVAITEIKLLSYQIGASPTTVVTSVDIRELGKAAPLAAEWMSKLERWTTILSKSSDSLLISSQVLEAWKAKLLQIHESVSQPKTYLKDVQVQKKSDALENEFVWDAISLSEGSSLAGEGKLHPMAMDEREIVIELQERSSELKSALTENNRVKQLLATEIANEQTQNGPVYQVQRKTRELHELTEILERSKQKTKSLAKEAQKLQVLRERQRSDMMSAKEELAVFKQLKEVAHVPTNSEEVMRSKIQVERAQAELVRTRAHLSELQTARLENSAHTQAVQAKNEILQQRIAAMMDKHRIVTEGNKSVKEQVQQSKEELDRARSDTTKNLELSAELKKRREEITLLTARLEKLEKAIAMVREPKMGSE